MHFFGGPRKYPAAAIAEFLADGVARGGTAAAIATKPHLQEIRKALSARGCSTDRIEMHNATDVLARASRFVNPVEGLRPVIEEMLETMTQGGKRAFIYGEMVDLLRQPAEGAATIELEQAWNDAMAGRQVALLCSYDLSAFASERDAAQCLSICEAHHGVTVDVANDNQALFTNALLVQLNERARLGNELVMERSLAAEHEARERLTQLQEVTSALSGAVTIDDIVSVLGQTMCPTLEASRAFIVTPDSNSVELHVVGSIGIPRHVVERFVATPIDSQSPAADCYRTGRPIWLADPEQIARDYPFLPTEAQAIAGLPLTLAARRLGVITFGFPERQPFDSRQRALIEDMAHQAALALERARLYEQAERERERAESANRAKDEFLAMLGHELRNPLAAICTATELLKLTDDEQGISRIQAILERQTANMSRFVDELLDVSRVARGKVRPQKEKVDLASVVTEALLDRHEAIGSNGLTLRTQLSDTPVWMQGDRLRLVQVMDNLLSNALKFTKPGDELFVGLVRDDHEATVTIADTGAGIDGELLECIFEPFRQGPQELARTTGGLGLGLALVRGLVDLHGGTVAARSAGPGSGSEFTVRLPTSG